MQQSNSLSQIKQMNNSTNTAISSKTLPYQTDLAQQWFDAIQHQPWAMLLRSASPTHVDSRFDILVAKPVATLETRSAVTEIKTNDEVIESKDDPFTLLAHYQQRFTPALSSDEEIPFIGGALGYFSYDLGRRVEKLPEIATQDIAAPDMAVGIYTWALIVDHQMQKAQLVGQNVEQAYQWLSMQTQTTKATFTLTSDWQSNMSRHDYQSKFDRVQEYLLSGDCYQINLAQRFHATYQGSEWQAYQRLEQSNQAPFSAFIRLEDAAILSVSPERFLELKKRIIETKPIKGTRPRHNDERQDKQAALELANADKDQAENLMIVDLLRNDIGRVAKPGSVHVPKLFDIESFPAVHHLVSTIRAELAAQYTAADLLRACFPGGSITGAPKVRAMEIIEELEPHRRSAYCGSIGYISRHGRMDTSITIRTLVAEQGKLFAWAGGGVVADSQCDAEYQETLDKLSKILPILQ
ncbi:aminodeoxychorismate synthase component 1 [Vibrio vulnificus]|uniref:aminodeoxychorismate synthase component 1 n=1 Tax=Vibrio vulnificus TaxID=672 RepID=UPI001A1F12A6|nr:aminodeoxychorismate synthase component 1 [Vibrio vulnificus]MCA3904281.1 aminodeoxychorismate synthase component 1 [Vibrio vulnificus]HAS8472453.1 aminodeoxychorismate synthase component 1 [Vibrio vulnificus]